MIATKSYVKQAIQDDRIQTAAAICDALTDHNNQLGTLRQENEELKWRLNKIESLLKRNAVDAISEYSELDEASLCAAVGIEHPDNEEVDCDDDCDCD